MYSVMTSEVARARMADHLREYRNAYYGELPRRDRKVTRRLFNAAIELAGRVASFRAQLPALEPRAARRLRQTV